MGQENQKPDSNQRGGLKADLIAELSAIPPLGASMPPKNLQSTAGARLESQRHR